MPTSPFLKVMKEDILVRFMSKRGEEKEEKEKEKERRREGRERSQIVWGKSLLERPARNNVDSIGFSQHIT